MTENVGEGSCLRGFFRLALSLTAFMILWFFWEHLYSSGHGEQEIANPR